MRAQLEKWLSCTGIPPSRAGTHFGVSSSVLYRVLNGENISEASRVNIEGSLSKPPKIQPQIKHPEGKATLSTAVKFLQAHVNVYRHNRGYTLQGTAKDLGVPLTALEGLRNGHLPSIYAIACIANRIPEVSESRRILFEARRRQEST